MKRLKMRIKRKSTKIFTSVLELRMKQVVLLRFSAASTKVNITYLPSQSYKMIFASTIIIQQLLEV